MTVQRDIQSEELLDQVGQSVWVFRHTGGPLTTRFVISHRPVGKDQKETVLFEGSGDDLQAGLNTKTGTFDAGFIVIHRPGKFDLRQTVMHSFSSGSVHCRQEEAASRVFPASIIDSNARAEMQEVSTDAFEIKAGETMTILDDACIYHDRDNDPDRPVAERESLHYVLTVTASPR